MANGQKLWPGCLMRCLQPTRIVLLSRFPIHPEIIHIRNNRDCRNDQREEAHELEPINYDMADGGADKVETKSGIGPLFHSAGQSWYHQEYRSTYFECKDHIGEIRGILQMHGA